MARETWVQSQVESYQRLKKWYLMPPCLTLSIIRYGSRVKWSNPGKGVSPFPTPWCSSYQKGSLLVTLDYGRQLYFTKILKKEETNNRRKEQTNTDLELQAQKNEDPTLPFYGCMLITIAITQRKSDTTTKNADSSGPCPGLDFLTLGPNWLPLYSGLTDVFRPSLPI